LTVDGVSEALKEPLKAPLNLSPGLRLKVNQVVTNINQATCLVCIQTKDRLLGYLSKPNQSFPSIVASYILTILVLILSFFVPVDLNASFYYFKVSSSNTES